MCLYKMLRGPGKASVPCILLVYGNTEFQYNPWGGDNVYGERRKEEIEMYVADKLRNFYMDNREDIHAWEKEKNRQAQNARYWILFDKLQREEKEIVIWLNSHVE